MNGLIAGIKSYEGEYSRMPTSTNAFNVAANAQTDYTFGTANTGFSGTQFPQASQGYDANNSELIAIIMDLEKFRDGSQTINQGHVRNPRQHPFFQSKDSNGSGPGVDAVGVLRDPWGNPYIVTLDMNDDNICQVPFYGPVSGSVAVWSLGPDRTWDPNTPVGQGANKDNILSWK
jgi:hypothetical protein